MEHISRDTVATWSFLSDQVMGGVSEGGARYGEKGGTGFLRLTGEVSTQNRGGFLQMRRDVAVPPAAQGIRLKVRGNGRRYYVHLRMTGLKMPWQFYQAGFDTTPDWREVRLPFSDFQPKGGFQRAALRPDTVKSLGIAAYGEAFHADISVAEVGFY
ncbi:CIA30 family protein [Rhodovulum sp. P5]|uniref:CIA30 family protein n=1 Tax=Rhodovulum sp. P5 TaxID=1564506 RepID=UPI00156154FB|nr:CIA30 family protein [Rhodovulum sp. P5]